MVDMKDAGWFVPHVSVIIEGRPYKPGVCYALTKAISAGVQELIDQQVATLYDEEVRYVTGQPYSVKTGGPYQSPFKPARGTALIAVPETQLEVSSERRTPRQPLSSGGGVAPSPSAGSATATAAVQAASNPPIQRASQPKKNGALIIDRSPPKKSKTASTIRPAPHVGTGGSVVRPTRTQ